MKKVAHTPGPWRIVADQPLATRVGHAICSVEKAFGTISIHAEPDDKPCPDIATWNEMSEANAALIAAAPETARKLAEAEAKNEKLKEALENAEPYWRLGNGSLVAECEFALKFKGDEYTNADALREERILEDSEARICYDRF